MCGIVGFTGKKNQKLLVSLLKTIKHRGYDETSYYFAKGVNLGMNRFAIIDLAKGLYPMTYKHFVLIFNGEIYNFRELKRVLENKGVSFKTNSDAEVILFLFDIYGPKAFEMLEGMFAIAILDKEKNKLILARDKFGEKPLYYCQNGKQFIFASEIKTLLSSSRLESILELNSLSSYLHHGSVFGNKTLVKKIEKLRPSQYLVFNLKSGKITKDYYWKPRTKQSLKSTNLRRLASELSGLIEDSVKKRLLADVPVGSFLSGGVDSSLIAYFATKNVKKLKTYSVAFPESLKYNEAIFAKKVASRLETDHTEIICTPEKLIPVIEGLGKYIDEPIVDPAVLPTFFLAKEARRLVKVVLSGEGADELFGGYYRYHKELIAQKLSPINKFLPRLPGRFNKILNPLYENYSPQFVWTYRELEKLLNIRFSKVTMSKKTRAIIKKDPLLALQLYDIQGYLSEQLLMKVDKTTMIHNLESRAPFLDTEIVNFALSLPSKYKVRGVHGKYILKKVAERYLPKTIVWRPKHGFSLPLNTWFRGPWKGIGEVSLEELKPYHKIFNLDYYEEILHMHMKKESDYGNKIFSMVALAKWLSHHKIKT
jgi:asparagine synthase (glutamine-hydrolysing)